MPHKGSTRRHLPLHSEKENTMMAWIKLGILVLTAVVMSWAIVLGFVLATVWMAFQLGIGLAHGFYVKRIGR
jgi:hypothetical protein